MDWQWKNSGVTAEHPEYDLLPSEYFQRQIYGCFWFERETLKHAVDVLGPDNLLYETDFPHPTCMYPGPGTSATTPREYIEDVPHLHTLNIGHAIISRALFDGLAAAVREMKLLMAAARA